MVIFLDTSALVKQLETSSTFRKRVSIVIDLLTRMTSNPAYMRQDLLEHLWSGEIRGDLGNV